MYAFTDAHFEAQRKVMEFLKREGEQVSAEVQVVVRESEEEVTKADAALLRLNINNATMQSMHTKQAIRAVLRAQEQLIETLEADGMLTEDDAHAFYKKIRHNFRLIAQSSNILKDNFDLGATTHGSDRAVVVDRATIASQPLETVTESIRRVESKNSDRNV